MVIMSKTIIIAEVGVNHNGNLNLAKKMIVAAKKIGANYVKFQCYKSKNIVHQHAKLAEYQKKINLKFSNQFELLKHLELSQKNIKILNRYAKQNKIGFLCSVFDLESAKFIRKLKCDYIKIPSGEITNFQLLKLIGSFKKKVIISSGGSNFKEILNAKKILNNSGLKDEKITLLHCISSYPTKNRDINLNAIDYLKEKINLNIGLSDHTNSTSVASYAVCKGAKIIEKHITLDNNMKGPDHKSSLNIKKFKVMISKIRELEMILGKKDKVISESERKNIPLIRKSIFASRKIKKNEILSLKNIMSLRPVIGIPAENFFKILNKRVNKNIMKNQPIFQKDIK